MANGKFHDSFNLVLGVILSVLVFTFSVSITSTLLFLVGWTIATFILSPDLDIKPKKRLGVLQFVLYPYSIIFKHRGVSHSFFLGTWTRIIYVLTISITLIALLSGLGIIKLSKKDAFNDIYNFIINFNLNEPIYRYLVIFYLGMLLADVSHLLVDNISTRIKKFIK